MRSCTAGATPGLFALSVGELALNSSDGKIFTKGCSGQFFTWSSDGSTADDAVLSVNGATGTVTFQYVSSFNSATGAVQGVGSFNGATGAIVGVNSVNGATGAVTFADLVGVCSVNGFTGAVDFTTKTFHAAGFSTQGGITAEGNSHKLGIIFESFPSGVTIAATNQRQVITLGAGAAPHGAKLTLHSGSAHREVLQANHDGMTIGVPVGISGGLCAAGANFSGITGTQVDVVGGDIDVRGGTIKFGQLAFGNHTSYSFPTTYLSSSINGEYGTYKRGPKILYQTQQSTGIGSDHPLAFADIGELCVLNVDGATGSIKCGTGLTIGGPGGGNTLGIDSASHIVISGISASAGATFAGNVTIKSAGDVALNLIADTDNSGENDNPIISMGQDGGVGTFELGVVGDAGQIYTNSTSNSAFLNTGTSYNDLQFATNDTMRMTILRTGQIGIGTKTPASSLDVVGGISLGVSGITFPDGTHQNTIPPTQTNVATFSIDASSGIATGAKTKALHRVPYDATLTKFELKSSAAGLTGAVYVAGSDFGLPTTGAVTGCSLGVSGLTGSSTVFNNASITAGNFLYFEVFNNTNGATNAQAFLTYTRR